MYDDHLRQIVLSEELGFTSYWFAEHHFDTYRMAPHPNLLIAAAARETSRLQLGNMVTVLPFHNPVRVAEEQAMLDHLTNGRLQVGIGRGVQPPEFAACTWRCRRAARCSRRATRRSSSSGRRRRPPTPAATGRSRT